MACKFVKPLSRALAAALTVVLLLLSTVVIVSIAPNAGAQGRPPAPTNVAATVDETNTVTVTWDRVAEADFYFLQWTKADGSGQRYQWARQTDSQSLSFTAPAGAVDVARRVGVQARTKRKQKSELTWTTIESATVTPTTEGSASLCETGQPIHERLGASGYDQARLPLEAHVWFFPTERDAGGAADGHSFGHAHMLTCVPFPEAQGGDAIVDTDLALDIEIQAHLGAARDLKNNFMPTPASDVRVVVREIEIRGVNGPGRDRLVDRFFADELYGCSGAQEKLRTQAELEDACSFINCTVPSGHGAGHDGHLGAGTCISTINLRGSNAVPLDSLDRNGEKQLRVAAVHEIYIGTELVAEMRAIGRAPFDLAVPDGRGRINVNAARSVTESSGWLIQESRDGAGGYASVALDWPEVTDRSAGSHLSPIASVPQGESFTIDVNFNADSCVRNCANEQVPVKNFAVYLNPDFHQSGWVTERIDHSFGIGWGGLEEDERITVSTAGLEPGPHFLMIATEQPMVDGLPCTNTQRGCDGNLGVWDVAPEWSSTLTGIHVVHFVVS